MNPDVWVFMSYSKIAAIEIRNNDWINDGDIVIVATSRIVGIVVAKKAYSLTDICGVFKPISDSDVDPMTFSESYKKAKEFVYKVSGYRIMAMDSVERELEIRKVFL